jgi:zinc transport system ATP-binding protein
MTPALLTLDRITVQLSRRVVLEQVSLQLRRGEILTVIGPNGAGKSTLIKTALGLLQPAAGTVHKAPGLRVGYMPQRLHVDPSLPITVTRFLRLGGAGLEAIAAALLEVDMGAFGRAALQELSGGELQRVLLARALLRQPDILVLDEPAQGVDLAGQTAMYELIDNLRLQHGCGVLMVSHDLHWVMAKTDNVLCLNQHVCCQGHPEQVGNDPAYQALFGASYARSIALYQHHHNHEHGLHGEVLEEGHQHG